MDTGLAQNPVILLDPGTTRKRRIMEGLVSNNSVVKHWRPPGLAWPQASVPNQSRLIDRAVLSATHGNSVGLKNRAKRLFLKAQTSSLLKRISRLDHPHTLLIWNGIKGHRGIATQLMRAAGHEVVQLEEAPLPGRLQVSSIGINADLTLPTQAEFYLNHCKGFTRVEVDQALKALRQQFSPRQPRRNDVKQLKAKPDTYREKFIFFPLQVPGDSQLSLHGGIHQDQRNTLLWIADAAALLPDGWHIRIKEHPSARKSLTADIHNINSPKLVLDNQTSSLDLLRASQALLTINSSLGLQAMLEAKPVLALGEAFWAFEPLCACAKTIDQLHDALRAPHSWTYDQNLRDGFIHFLANSVFPSEKDVITGEFTLANLMTAQSSWHDETTIHQTSSETTAP